MRTIVGIATPPGIGGVGIVRLSGSKAVEIAGGILRSKIVGDRLEPRVATLCDDMIVIHFPRGNSFTGEDVVEFQAHGSPLVLGGIVRRAIELGAHQAEPGEFSRQAFLNGRMSLDQAEALIETIHAQSDLELRNASLIHQGRLRSHLCVAETALVDVMARITATMDYPEHDIEHVTAQGVLPDLQKVAAQIRELTDTAAQGRMLADGVQVAVLGKPNVGKSSLFNAILARDRSIVTDICGTTTDTVSETIVYNGVRLVFHDTAGIRDGVGKVEQLGIERTRRVVAESDVVLCIFDGSQPPDDCDREVLALAEGKTAVYVMNKHDLGVLKKWGNLIEDTVLRTVASEGKGVLEVKAAIFDKSFAANAPSKRLDISVTNQRHLAELTLALECLARATEGVGAVPLDCIATEVQGSLTHLGNISGTHTSEAVVDEIFKRFCLGK